jgi:hypothetical protein
MVDIFESCPDRIVPYVILGELNQPVPLVSGPFRLIGPSEGTLEADLKFRWLPSPAVSFEGLCSHGRIDIVDESWHIESEGELAFSAPVTLTRATLGHEGNRIGGIVKGFDFGDSSFEVLRFSLANFPDYNGKPVKYEHNGYSGIMRARLEASAGLGQLTLDAIPEAEDLRKSASRDVGFVISHVGEWRLRDGRINASGAGDVLKMLHFLFGFLRGAWSGPLFPQGLVENSVRWRQFAPWKLREEREVTSWMPQRKPLDLSDLFPGFFSRWSDPAWQSPLISSISWLVEANSRRSSPESKIVLAQVALDLLAWVHLVETNRLHSRADFKRLSAAGRIRALLHRIGVPTSIPAHLTDLPSLHHGDAFDGPGVITRVRNALVHAAEENRSITASLEGLVLFQCSQLALQYVELALLSVCGYSGYYAQRGWTGWKGDDEILVPWAREMT